MSDKDRGRPWLDEWTEKLKQLFTTGMSFSRIAAEIGNGLTRNACIGRAHRLGLERRGQVRGDKHPKRLYKKLNGPRPNRAKFSLPPIEIETLRCSVVEPLHIALLDLTADQCRWPNGNFPFTFCGHHKFNGFSYCASHYFLSVGAGTASERAADRVTRLHLEGAP